MSGKQVECVLALLQERGEAGITPGDILERCGSQRGGARIWDLRHQGHLITTETVEVPTRLGGTAHVARYRLISDGGAVAPVPASGGVPATTFDDGSPEFRCLNCGERLATTPVPTLDPGTVVARCWSPGCTKDSLFRRARVAA